MQKHQSTVMVCIATGQTLPNLIPILINKPNVVVILTTTEMEKKAHQLEICIKQNVASCQVEILTGSPDSLLNDIWDYGKQTSEYLRTHYPNNAITFNATGGTKLMFIGFVTSMREVFNEMIYVDTDKGRIEFLPKDSVQKSPELLPSVINTRQYLAAQGFVVRSIASEDQAIINGIEKRREITMLLAKDALEFDNFGFIAALNRSMQGVLKYDKKNECNTLLKHDVTLHIELSNGKDAIKFMQVLSKWKQILNRGQQLNLFTWNEAQSKLGWADVRTAEYLSGIWLEEYVYLQAKSLNLTDVSLGVKAKNEAITKAQYIGNEYDVLITHQNKMLVIECKTVNFKTTSQKNVAEKSNALKANDIAYKFGSLSERLKGIFGEAWLVSSSSANVIHDKATDLGFRVIEPGQLNKIAEIIAKWAGVPPPVKLNQTQEAIELPQGALQAALQNLKLS